MNKCTKPNCDCVEIAEQKNGGNPVKSYPCLHSDFDADQEKQPVKEEKEVPKEDIMVVTNCTFPHCIGDDDCCKNPTPLQAVDANKDNPLLTKLKAMQNESFEGWSEDAKNGYLTAVITIQEFGAQWQQSQSDIIKLIEGEMQHQDKFLVVNLHDYLTHLLTKYQAL